MKLRRKHNFTLIEICISISILVLLASTFSFIGYDAIKEFRKRNAITAFQNYLYELRDKNASTEHNILLSIIQDKNQVKTQLEGSTTHLHIKSLKKAFYIPNFLEQNKPYLIPITAQNLPTNSSQIPNWLTQNNCSHKFYSKGSALDPPKG